MLTYRDFELLKSIEENNNREWYSENKADFKAHLRDPFAGFLSEATEKLEHTNTPLIGHEKTMFR